MAATTETVTNSLGVELTEPAAARVREFIAREGGIGLRVDVRRTGCSGWAYDVGIARQTEENDRVFESQGLKVVVSDKAIGLVAGTTVDFVHEGLTREFRFRNPNVTGECGCGESFTVG
ncbi:MAG: iron-sulfur cluster assembly accessory protein [Wenzhouxiangella sp.]|nr:iron-sulfur cluster assembly accessory protein [Wenzhouxiangella sp.]MCH8477857.1 iron-sulfur cluster assembly accessory protein [Wenzhouxiangella sp.]TVR91271.1 MAG: iron-sulfur cluster assembly accessory protein [Wenzhouxiangellaceae bacterium]